MKSNTLFFMTMNFTEASYRLNKLLGDVVISQGGVVPHIAAVRGYAHGTSYYALTHAHSGTLTQQIKQVPKGSRRGIILSHLSLLNLSMFLYSSFVLVVLVLPIC
jgi:hypothetical protein